MILRAFAANGVSCADQSVNPILQQVQERVIRRRPIIPARLAERGPNPRPLAGFSGSGGGDEKPRPRGCVDGWVAGTSSFPTTVASGPAKAQGCRQGRRLCHGMKSPGQNHQAARLAKFRPSLRATAFATGGWVVQSDERGFRMALANQAYQQANNTTPHHRNAGRPRRGMASKGHLQRSSILGCNIARAQVTRGKGVTAEAGTL